MTLFELLKELRWVDRDVYETLRNYPIYCSVGEALTVNLLDSSNQILVEDAIQGSIQRGMREVWMGTGTELSHQEPKWGPAQKHTSLCGCHILG